MSFDASQKSDHFKARPRQQRLYAFAITAITTFLLVILVWQVPVSGFLAETSLRVEGGTDSQPVPSLAEIRKVAQAEQVIAAVTRAVMQEERVEVAAVRANLFFTAVDDAPSTSSLRFRLGYRGASPEQAVAIANEFSRQLQASLSDSFNNQDLQAELAQVAQQEVDDAIQENASTQQEMQQLLSQHLALLERQLHSSTAATQKEATNDESSTSVPVSDDPALVKLKQDLAKLREEYHTLGMLRTDKHPAMQNLVQRMSDLQKEIDGYAESTPLPPIETVGSEVNTTVANEVPTPLDAGELRALTTFSQEYNLLNERLSAAQHRLTSSLESLAETRRQLEAVEPLVATITAPAAGAQRMGGSPPPGRVILGGLLGVALGGCVAWWLGAPARAQVLATKQDIEEQVGVPVCASISTGAAQADPLIRGSAGRRRVANRIASVCEVALITVLILIIAVAVFDSPLASEFVDDPFGALTESIRRLVP